MHEMSTPLPPSLPSTPPGHTQHSHTARAGAYIISGDTDVLYLYYADERYPELREASDAVLAKGASDKSGKPGSSGDEETENGAGVEGDGGGGGSGGGGVGGCGGAGDMEALKSNAGSRDSQAETQQLTQAKEAFESFVRMVGGKFGSGDPNAAASAAAAAVTAAAAASATSTSTGSTMGQNCRDLERMKQQAEVDLQLARLEKVKEEKSVQSIAKRRQLREEYTQLRTELRKEKAEPEPDDVYIATLEEGLAATLEAMSQGNKSLGVAPPPRR